MQKLLSKIEALQKGSENVDRGRGILKEERIWRRKWGGSNDKGCSDIIDSFINYWANFIVYFHFILFRQFLWACLRFM